MTDDFDEEGEQVEVLRAMFDAAQEKEHTRRPHWWERLRRRKAHYRVTIIGTESGNVTRLSFMTFNSENKAKEWVDRMNAHHPDADPPLTRYSYEAIPK